MTVHSRKPRPRRGIALMDVVVGGIILAIGLAVVISLTARSLSTQTEGEKQMTGSWLLDGMLAMVVVQGPVVYKQTEDTHGRFGPPFEDFEFDIVIQDQGLTEPYLVTAIVRWPHGQGFREAQAQTLIATRNEDYDLRRPPEPIDRYSRWYPDEEETDTRP